MKNIFSIIVIVVSIATFVLFVRPQYAEIKKMEEQSSELEGVLDNARKLQRLRDSLIEKQQKISASDISRLEKLIPENSDNVKLILEFQKIAEQYNLEIQTASSSTDDEEEVVGQNFDIETKDYGIITINFSLSGEYRDFIDFLRSVEQNLRIADITEMTLTPQGGEDDIGQYEYTLVIDTYWLKDNI